MPSETEGRVTNAMLFQKLGELTQLVATTSDEVGRLRSQYDSRWSADQTRMAKFQADLTTLTAIVMKIKGPVEAAMTLRNFFVGAAALLSAIGILLGLLHSSFAQWLGGFFHH